jgi:hypothetical protein
MRIREVKLENFHRKAPVLYFAGEGKIKGLILNKTNASTIAVLYSEEIDAWRRERRSPFVRPWWSSRAAWCRASESGDRSCGM